MSFSVTPVSPQRGRRDGHGPPNYQFERASVALNGATPTTILGPPPKGVSYRVFYINGFNASGATRTLFGRILANGTAYPCFEVIQIASFTWITGIDGHALAEFPTICVLDNTDETLEVWQSTAGTPTISCCYEIVEQTGVRTFRNGLATTNGTSQVELVPAPTSETVHRILSVNGHNDSGGNRSLYLDAGTGSPTERMFELFCATGRSFRRADGTYQAPFPPFILSSTSDSLVMSLSGTGTFNISASYEVLSRRVV